MDENPSGLTQNIMTDSYTFQHRRRSVSLFRAALLLVVALLFAAPSSAQTIVYQFTGTADGEVDDVPFAGKLVRIELVGLVINNTHGALQAGTDGSEESATVISSGIIVVDGQSYPLDVTGMTIRRPDNNPIDGSTHDLPPFDPPASPGFNGPEDLEYPGLAIHDFGSSTFYHYFKGRGVNSPLTQADGAGVPDQTDLISQQNGILLEAQQQNRGGTGANIGYTVTGGGATKIEIDFIVLGGDLTYNMFSGGGGLDYGDAPDAAAGSAPGDYKTRSADGGPSHFLGGPVLGSAVTDADSGLLENVGASADDADGTDDEDGVTFSTSIVASAGQSNTATFTVEVSSGPGTLDAWVDFDQDGLFDVSEKVFDTVVLANGFHQLPVTIPAGATPGTTYARFRISTGGTALPFGSAADGEVEDYQITILNGGGSNPIGLDLGGGGIIQPITITRVPGAPWDAQVKHTGGTLFQAPLSAVGALTVIGTSGDDDFIIDYVNGSPSNGPITVDGAGQAGIPGDNLRLENGTQDTIHHTYYDPTAVPAENYSGKIEYTAGGNPTLQTVNYVRLEPIVDLMVTLHRIFTFNAVANNVKFDYVAGPGPSTIETIPVTSEHTTFTNPSVDMIINGLGGGDTFDIEPSLSYPITVNGDAPSTFVGGDTFNLDAGSLPPATTITLTETSSDAGIYTFDNGVFPLAYNTMEIVGLRFSDPNAFPLATYPGDMVYPIHTETGISIEPYFNWDIENWPLTPATLLTTLLLEVSPNANLSSPVFSTTVKEDGVTPLVATLPGEDHYITDVDRQPQDAGIPLLNNTTYYWGLSATLAGGSFFKQISRFKTVPALKPIQTYPKDGLTIPSLSFDFHWNVASPTQPSVYWRMDLDANLKAAFNGATPSVMGGDAENDNDVAAADGFASATQFDTDDLPTPLLWGTTYTWRLATMWPVAPTGWVPQEIFDKNETDRMVGLSNLFQFQTQTKAFVPTPSYPTGGLTVPTNEPELNWWVGGPFGALTFEVEIWGVAPDPVVVVCTAAGIVGTQFDTSGCGLVPGKTYSWRVRSTDGAATSAYSAFATFTLNGQGVAGPATPSYPIGNLEIYTVAPQFHWFTRKDNTNSVSFVAWYKKRVGPAAATCAAVQIGGTSLASTTNTYVNVTGLEPGATYDWCVVTTGLNGSFDSPVAVFNIAGGLAKNFPVASWPKGNPTTYSLTQLVHWYLEGSYFDLVSYDVEWCKGVPTGSNPVFGAGGPSCTTVTGITTMQHEITGLTYGDKVIWRVKANYTSGPPSDWTMPVSQGSFTVTGLLSNLAANLTYPVGDLIVYDSDLTFSWFVSGGVNVANMFKIQYSYAETFPMIGNVTIETTSTVPFLNVTGLIPGHTYWWRVAVSNDGGATYGAWSTVASFAVHPGASAVMPRIGSPANTMTIGSKTPTLSWVLPAESESALTYDLRYSTSENMESGATLVEGITVPFAQLNELTAGQYYWQVRSRTASGDVSPFSPVGSFSTTASFSVGIEDEVLGELPAQFELGQNYPNPFNPTTTIEFRMSESANVSIKVYNVLGQVVKTLVSGTLPSGAHQVTWDAKDESGAPVSSGLYMYRMETAGFNVTKTLVLMK